MSCSMRFSTLTSWLRPPADTGLSGVAQRSHGKQVPQAAFGVLGGSTLDRQDQIPRGSPAGLDDPCPVDHAVAACTAEHPAALAPVSLGVLRGDVLGVDVDDLLDRVFQPEVGIVAAEEAVPRIEVDA